MIRKIIAYFKGYYQRKSTFALISDIAFILLIIALLIPSSRIAITSFVLRIVAPQPRVISSESRELVGSDTWNWMLESDNSKQIRFGDLRSKPIFLNFWATWCPPCVAELPSIQKLYNEYGDRVNLVLLTNEEPDKVMKFMNDKGYNLPVYFTKYQTPKEFRSSSIPTSFLVSKSGEIIIRKTGAAKWNGNRIKRTLDELLAE